VGQVEHRRAVGVHGVRRVVPRLVVGDEPGQSRCQACDAHGDGFFLVGSLSGRGDSCGEVHGPFAGIVADVAHDLVERYMDVRKDTKVFVQEAGQLDGWLDILDPARIRRHL
jgi:hypothetical protein